MKKAVILAAGWGTRMRPLTETRPKPSLKIAGKTLVEHNLDQLNGLVEEVVVVIGYKGEIIKNEIGDNYKDMRVRYATQKEPIGTGDAARAALPFLDDQFLILNGDDLYKRKDLEKCLEKNPSIMVKEVEDPTGFGQMISKGGKIVDLVEKPVENVSNLVNIGAYYINRSFFEKGIEKSKRGEYEITDYIKRYLSEETINCHVAEVWDSVSYPWNLLESAEHIFDQCERNIEGEVEEGVVLEGTIYLGVGSVVKSGSRIEGPAYIGKDCVIGPNAYIRGRSSIEDDCYIGQAVEVKNSIIGSGTRIPHLSYVGDSVIGEGCNLGAGTIIANLRFEEEEIRTEVKGKMVKTGRKKMGAVLGDGVKTGINVSIMPGVMISSNTVIYPGETIKKNIKKDE